MKKLVLIISIFCTVLRFYGMQSAEQVTKCQLIYEKHIETLAHVDVCHRPLFICFSGVPGMGKTFVGQDFRKKVPSSKVLFG